MAGEIVDFRARKPSMFPRPVIQFVLLLCPIAISASAPISAAEVPARTPIQEVRASGGMVVSDSEIASRVGGDHVRIASQLIPGIGFIGAGAIIHEAGSVVGLTTAATIFVMASVGMAIGGGLYMTAVFA